MDDAERAARLGEVIKRWLLDKGLNQTQLAKLTDYTLSYISKVIGGSNTPSHHALEVIAQKLGTEASVLKAEAGWPEGVEVKSRRYKPVIGRPWRDALYGTPMLAYYAFEFSEVAYDCRLGDNAVSVVDECHRRAN